MISGIVPKPYRYAYIVDGKGYDFMGLEPLVQDVRFVLPKDRLTTDMREEVGLGMMDFDPLKDLLVPVGAVHMNLMAGIAAAQICKRTQVPFVKMALLIEHQYVIVEIDTRRCL